MRAAPGTPHPRPKSAFSDSVGWGAWGPTAEMCSWLNSGHQIKVRIDTNGFCETKRVGLTDTYFYFINGILVGSGGADALVCFPGTGRESEKGVLL